MYARVCACIYNVRNETISFDWIFVIYGVYGRYGLGGKL